jgi:hypothetical protein
MIHMAATDIYAKALCQLLEFDLIAKGLDPGVAKVLAGRACETTIKGSYSIGKKVRSSQVKKAKRALNSWQKFVKANKNKYKYKTGTRKGQVNFKKMSAAFKKTPAGKKGKKK